MNAVDALDPIRSLKAVGRTAAAAPAPLLLWWFGGFALLFAIYLVAYASGFALAFTAMSGGDEPSPGMVAVLVAGGLVFVVVFGCAQFVWQMGFAAVFEEALRRGAAEVSTGLATWRRLPAAIGSQLLVGLITLLVYAPFFVLVALSGAIGARSGEFPPLLVLAIPVGLATLVAVVWLSLGFLFAIHAVAIDGCGPIEALARSWALARGRRWRLLGFVLATALFVLAGLLVFCVGYVFTGALGMLMPAELYVALTRGEGYDRYWVATGTPPGDAAAPEVP